MKILLVEDEIKIASFVKRGLREVGMNVECAFSGEEALDLLSEVNFDLIILDWMLPTIDGVTVLATLREENKQTPVIMLTAKSSVSDKVKGLDTGADDYLVKPFSFEELLARIRSLMRRRNSRLEDSDFYLDDLKLDCRRRKLFRSTQEVPLSNREYLLLEYLMRNIDHVLSRSMILEHVWETSFDSGTNIVEVTINHLRSKIDSGREKKLLHTLRGQGYLLGLSRN